MRSKALVYVNRLPTIEILHASSEGSCSYCREIFGKNSIQTLSRYEGDCNNNNAILEGRDVAAFRHLDDRKKGLEGVGAVLHPSRSGWPYLVTSSTDSTG